MAGQEPKHVAVQRRTVEMIDHSVIAVSMLLEPFGGADREIRADPGVTNIRLIRYDLNVVMADKLW